MCPLVERRPRREKPPVVRRLPPGLWTAVWSFRRDVGEWSISEVRRRANSHFAVLAYSNSSTEAVADHDDRDDDRFPPAGKPHRDVRSRFNAAFPARSRARAERLCDAANGARTMAFR